MSRTDAQDSTRRTFWITWQTFVAVPGIPLIAWLLLAPDDLALTGGQALGVWLAIFAVATVASFAINHYKQ